MTTVAPAPAVPVEHRPRLGWRGAIAGVLAAAVALAAAELVTGIVRGTASPVVAVGQWVIDLVPPGVREWAIDTFGTGDKAALVTGTVLLVAVAGGLLGWASVRRPWVGDAGIAAFGIVGLTAALTRPGATLGDALPSLVGALAGVAALHLLLRPLRPLTSATRGAEPAAGDRPADLLAVPATSGAIDRPAGTSTAPPQPGTVDRRRFLLTSVAVGAGAAAAGSVGRFLRERGAVAQARAAVRLPRAASPAPAVPASADVGVPGAPAFLTPSDAFYRIDTAILPPQVDPASWRLRIEGMVDRPLTFTYDQLLARPLVERDVTLVCVSNEVGGHLAGNARWLGVPLADLLREAGVHADASQLVSRSVDGFTAGTPTAVVLDGRDALVALGMNGQPLPVKHGFPARLVVPGLYGYVSATKWLSRLELTTLDAYDAYWVDRGWAKQAPIKLMSRVDTPKDTQHVPAGRVAIAGVAWAPHVGVAGVEVQVGPDTTWHAAKLGAVSSADTWRLWVLESDVTPGPHTVRVRAIDTAGNVQDGRFTSPEPDGATGWHEITFVAR